ncbi:carboxypeptidase-like regulatory domain-containing protein [Lujinxingia litoralis]|uniref:carboxypeptidase-like regulatory domain-containing protein n=1 Tax=Lujinxingia litoralis TaxID=2211119 RepID=UPI0013146B33|nr:carboxypeptidase regulatory-like domain-containing protein [Lujinxingia litoralis]
MKRGLKNAAGVGSVAVAGALLWATFRAPDGEQVNHVVEDEQGVLAPYQGGEDMPAERALAGEDAPATEARWLQVLDEDEGALVSRLMIGAAGMWPPLVERSDEAGYVALPELGVRTPGGDEGRYYEVLARSLDPERPGAFWGVVQGPGGAVFAEEGARALRTVRAADLELGIVDGAGAPVEGAFVRLSRESLALVHLHTTTRADGLARFALIPPGTYYVTIDAEGFTRRTLQVGQSAEAQDYTLQVELLKGGGLRMPQAWRAPVVDVLRARGASVSSLGAAGAEGLADGDDGAEEQGERAPVKIWVADPQGAGVSGAWVEIWAEGRRVARGLSQGSRALHLEVPAEAALTVYATHAGWGEGQVRLVRLGEKGEATLRLTGPILSVPVPDRERSMAAIEAALGQRVVDTGRGHQIDVVDPQSPAARAGVERGDALVFARRAGDALAVMVERGGQYLELTLRH